jgi:two-component system phosphate regulon sensor histidine kinase PhoR
MSRVIAILLLVIAAAILYFSRSPVLAASSSIILALISGALLTRKADGSSKESETLSPGDLRPRHSLLEPSQSERILKATMSGMREGVIVVDELMRVIAANDAGRSIFTRYGSDTEPRRLSELTRNRAIFDTFSRTIESGGSTEVKVETLETERRVFDLRVMPLQLGSETTVRGAMGVFFDITKLERLERVRQEFLSNVSHELRTPLTAIMAFVETLEDGAIEDAENNRRFLGVIRKNSERMRNLIDDILDLSAIEAGNVSVEPAPLELRELVNEIKTALASKAEEREVSIKNEVGEGIVVFADHRRLEQMLTNLMDNALKFNHRGGAVTVTYEAGPRDRVKVTDTGDGIASEHLARIFERFYRIDRARSREMGGTGLGLAIVKHLARLHGGEVSVTSDLGSGSTFTIELPRQELETQKSEMETERVGSGSRQNTVDSRNQEVRG